MYNRPDEIVYIIAGSYNQAVYLAYLKKIPNGMWKYISKIEQVYGLSGATVYLYGTYHLFPIYDKIIQAALAHNAHIERIYD
jgi:hypothetical protein